MPAPFATRLLSAGTILTLTLALGACAVNERIDPDGSSTLSGELVGAGSTAQEVGVQAWTVGFQTAHPFVTVNYDPSGSGAGRGSFQAGAVDFGGSDRAFTVEEIAVGPFDACKPGTDIVQLPSFLSPIVVVFNLEGIEELVLDGETIAALFAQKITRWDDPRIAALNPEVDLPSIAVTAVHRADDSGTTENFTDFLHEAAPEEWPYEADGVWPVRTGEAAQGTSGVVAAVRGGLGTIGYVDAARTPGFGTVALVVGDEIVEYSPEAAAAIVDASPYESGRTDGDLAVQIDRTPDIPAYPIVLISYMIACEQYRDPAAAELVRGFLEYVISPEGQLAAALAAGSAPVSESLRQRMAAAVALIEAPE